MCGIAGFWDSAARQPETVLRDTVAYMSDSLYHRGPDAGGVWVEATSGIALAHRRLAVIDLSPAAAQPMVSADGRYVITYNGEIYNYQALAAELRASGHVPPSGGDTAVLLTALAAWGPAITLPKLKGMFAFALWDRKERSLTLARDQLGVKPLCWAQFGSLLLFASDMRALLQHPDCPRRVERNALAHYFRQGNVPAPYAIFAGMHKLPPATMLTVRVGQEPQLTRYWDLNQIAVSSPACRLSFSQATDALQTLLRDVIKEQMVADVPLGTLLSGGIDSSLVTALLQEQSGRKVRSYSIGFDDADFDEAPYANAIAQHLGTEHTEAYVTPLEACEVIPLLPEIYDEPFADSSQIPSFLVARLARQQVTVALSGDGGDEAFLGYNRYLAWARMEQFPQPLWRALAGLSGYLTPERWNQIGLRLPERWRVPQLGDKLSKLAMMGNGDVADTYQALTSWWPEPEVLVAGITPLPPVLSYPAPDDSVAAMQLWDTLGYLPNDVLTKVDRASMAVALEVRVPYLDPRIIEFGWTLPRSYKLENGISKRILRQVLRRYVPDTLMDRPKLGFSVPLAAWLRGPLRDWAEHMLREDKLEEAGLEPEPVLAAWQEHLSERDSHQHRLWTVLMYIAWHQHWNIDG